MKKLLVFLPLFCLTAFGATVGYNNFDANQFGSNSFKLSVKSSVLLTNPISDSPSIRNGTLSGSILGATNFNLANGFTPTNLASTVIITLGQVQALTTNNNLSFVGLAGINATNFNPAFLIVTNTALTTNTATFAAGFQNMTDGSGSTIYWTNLLHVAVTYHNTGGTNFYYKSR